MSQKGVECGGDDTLRAIILTVYYSFYYNDSIFTADF